MKRFFHLASLMFFSTVFVFFCLEIILSLFWPHKITSSQYSSQYHQVLGWTNKQNIDGEMRLGPNLSFHWEHNSNGLRSLKEHNYDKPAGVRRILFLGDSFFWGMGVNDTEVLTNLLQQKIGADLEVINGAVSSYGTDQELIWLSEEGLKYKPDLVILGFFPANDWPEISNTINYGYPKPIFNLQDGNLIALNIPVPNTRATRRKAFGEPDTLFGKLKKFLRKHTHTYPFLARRLNRLPAIREFLLQTGIAEEFNKEIPGVLSMTLQKNRVQPLSEALIKAVRDTSADAGADFLLVFIPAKEQAPESPVAYEVARADAYWENTDFSRYLSIFTSENNMKFIDLLPTIRLHHQNGEYLYMPESIDHHWTAAGHKVAADTIYDWLRKNSYI